MMADGDTVLVAVSGGPDSSCLLDVLLRLADSHDYSIEVAHVDHGLTDDSARVAAEVAHRAASLGLEVHLVKAPGLSGPNLHARARDFRYAFFDAVASDIEAVAVATGHTLDDRVETTVARLVHGSGTEGLAGIPANQDRRIRPLIELRRSETAAYCREAGIDFVVDPANADPRFERTFVRAAIVAAVEAHFGEGAVRAMATSSERLAEDAAALRDLAAAAFEQIADREGGTVTFERDVFGKLPRAFQRRLLQEAVGQVRDRSGGIDAALDALGSAGPGGDRRFDVASGVEIVLSGDGLQVSRRMDP